MRIPRIEGSMGRIRSELIWTSHTMIERSPRTDPSRFWMRKFWIDPVQKSQMETFQKQGLERKVYRGIWLHAEIEEFFLWLFIRSTNTPYTLSFPCKKWQLPIYLVRYASYLSNGTSCGVCTTMPSIRGMGCSKWLLMNAPNWLY